MNPSKMFLTLGVVVAMSFRAVAAIPVTGSGAGPFDFSAAPVSPADFSTLSVAGGAGDVETVAAVDAAVVQTDAATVTTALGSSATVPPSVNAVFRRNTTLLVLQSHPTGNAYSLMLMTMQNAAGGTITSFKLNYDYGMANTPAAEAVPGYRVFFSVTGLPGTWQLLPVFSGLTANAPGLSETISGISWPSGANAYILWADDNSVPNLDQANTIDNLSITDVSTTIEPTTITITSPMNGQMVAPFADLTVTTTTTGGITNVAFLVDGVLFTNDTVFPYGGTVMVPGNLPTGPHTLKAVATDSTGGMAMSSVSFTVVANTPPTLAITNTFSGTITGMTFLVGSPVTVQAGFSDDDVITNITWLVDDVVYLTNRINGTWTYVNSLAGNHVLKGQAKDRAGNITTATRNITVTNPPASYTLLVTNSSTWRYFQHGATPAAPPDQTAIPWYNALYDDTDPTQWIDAFTELGNGDVVDGHPERTMIDIGPAGTRYSAMYFRKVFNVVDPLAFPTVNLRLLRDDGAVVYLNGTPVWTNNMTPTAFPIPYGDFAAASDDGLDYQILNLPNPPEALVIGPGPNLVAVEVHQQNAGSSDLSFDLMIWGTAIPNSPPSVTITNPVAGSNLMVGTFVLVGASASDSDGTVAQVQFFDNGFLRDTRTAAPYVFTNTDLTAGAHTISAVATDNSGSNSTASVMIMVTNPPALTAILTNGSDWKYLDTGVDQGTDWTALGFVDTSWSSGIGEFGYGDNGGERRPEHTVVSFGTDAANKHVTTYFRKVITVTNPNLFGRVRLDAMRDDGIVVHINGNEVFRNNFVNTTTPILFGDLAQAAIGGNDECTYISTDIPASVLVPGPNIVAVEIHQSAIDSSDISFDLMLWGTPPALTITTSGGNYTVSWNNAAGFKLQERVDLSPAGTWADVAGNPTSPFTRPLPAGPNQKYYRLLKP